MHFAGINPTEDGEGCKSNMTGGLQRASVAYIQGRRRRGQEEKQAAMLLIGPHQGQGKEQVPQCQNAAQSCPRWHHDPGPRTEPKPPLTQRAAQPAPSVQRPPVSSLLRRHSKFHTVTANSRAVTAQMRSACSSFPGCARLENWCPLVDSAWLKVTAGIITGCSLEPLPVGTLCAFPAQCRLLGQ